MQFSETEINIVLGIEQALHEREKDEMERQQRVNNAKQNFKRGR